MTVSIVIPTHERPDFLERLLRSIEKQTYRDFEVIVVDDCSKKKTEYQCVIESFQERFPRLIYVRNETNQGAPFSRNRGIRLAEGELIALVDDDDEWMPQKLEKQVDVFNGSDESLGLVYTWTKAMAKGKEVFSYQSQHEGNALSQLLRECFIPSPSVMVKRSALIEGGLFDEKMPSCQDWDMWTSILALGYTCGVVKSFQTIYHKHERATIGTSPSAYKGYELYYKKHLSLFRRHYKWMYFKLVARDFVRFLKEVC